MATHLRRMVVASSAMALALIGISTPSASAHNGYHTISCSSTDIGSSWTAICGHNATKDVGGQGGWAKIINYSTSDEAVISFEPYGEHVSIENYGSWNMDFAVTLKGSGANVLYQTLAPGQDADWNLSIAEGKEVIIWIIGSSSGRLYVSNQTLVA